MIIRRGTKEDGNLREKIDVRGGDGSVGCWETTAHLVMG